MSYETKNEDVKSDYLYLHINNGGIDFKIKKHTFSNDGKIIHRIPVLKIDASHMSVKTNGMEIPMTPERLKKMGEWFIQMSEESKAWYSNRDAGEDMYDGLLISCEKYKYLGEDKEGDPVYVSDRENSVPSGTKEDGPDGVEESGEIEILFRQQIDNPEIMTKDKKDKNKIPIPEAKYYNGEDILVGDAVLWALMVDDNESYKMIALKEKDIVNFTPTGVKSGSKIPFVKKIENNNQ